MTGATVTLEHFHGIVHLRVTWASVVDGVAINTTFRTMQMYLDATQTPLPVIFDMSQCVRFSAPDVLRGALFGPFRHPMLDEWLVIGADTLARNVGRVLSNVTGIHNIHWFFTHEQAYTHLLVKAGLDPALIQQRTQSA
ncbi:MAG: hypothetical protein NZM00_08555 [Anaerolinea sp.]|nr:hypothetical protein [Anaerolinea sp.]